MRGWLKLTSKATSFSKLTPTPTTMSMLAHKSYLKSSAASTHILFPMFQSFYPYKDIITLLCCFSTRVKICTTEMQFELISLSLCFLKNLLTSCLVPHILLALMLRLEHARLDLRNRSRWLGMSISSSYRGSYVSFPSFSMSGSQTTRNTLMTCYSCEMLVSLRMRFITSC